VTAKQAEAFPRRDAPGLCRKQRPKKEGAGNAGRPERPQPRVVCSNTRVSQHGQAGSSGIPRAMVLTVSFVISPVTGLCCHRRR